MLIDIDDLALQCRDVFSRRYIEEAVSCYKIGAYRSCIIATWTAVCYDLFRKIRELAHIGDARAKELVQKLDTYRQQIAEGNQQGYKAAIEFERSIIEHAAKLELVDESAAVSLRRIQEDRNRCAHPNFERHELPVTISAEEARVHLRNAVVDVLAQPPVQGRAALDQLRLLISSETFPSNKAEIDRVIKSSYVRKASDALVRGFVDMLLHELLESEPAWTKSAAVSVLDTLSKMHPHIAPERVSQQISKIFRTLPDEYFGRFAYLAISIPHGWISLSEGDKTRICTYIKNTDFVKLIDLLHLPLGEFRLRLAVRDRYQRCEIREIKLAVENGIKTKEILDEIVNRYCNCKNWDSANYVCAELVMPVAWYLSKEHIEKIVSKAAEGTADLVGSFQFPPLLRKVADYPNIGRDWLTATLRQHGLDDLAEQIAEAPKRIDEIPF